MTTAVIDKPEDIARFAAAALATACEVKANTGVSLARNLPTVKEIRRRYPQVTAKTYRNAAAQLREHYT
jgi:hypothetical protein